MGQCAAPCDTCYDGLDAMFFRHLPKVLQMKLSQLMSDDGEGVNPCQWDDTNLAKYGGFEGTALQDLWYVVRTTCQLFVGSSRPNKWTFWYVLML